MVAALFAGLPLLKHVQGPLKWMQTDVQMSNCHMPVWSSYFTLHMYGSEITEWCESDRTCALSVTSQRRPVDSVCDFYIPIVKPHVVAVLKARHYRSTWIIVTLTLTEENNNI